MHHFDDPATFAKRLDAHERDAWQKPEEIIDSFRLPHDAIVADIGAGTGYFVVRLAQYLTHGKVIGLDEEPRMVAYLQQRVVELGLTNVETRLIQAEAEIPLEEKVDLLLCVDTYHHIANRVAYFSRYRKYLKAEGKLCIIDRAVDAPEGPPPSHRLSPDRVKAELQNAGFALVLDRDFLLPYQYYLVFERTTDATR